MKIFISHKFYLAVWTVQQTTLENSVGLLSAAMNNYQEFRVCIGGYFLETVFGMNKIIIVFICFMLRILMNSGCDP